MGCGDETVCERPCRVHGALGDAGAFPGGVPPEDAKWDLEALVGAVADQEGATVWRALPDGVFDSWYLAETLTEPLAAWGLTWASPLKSNRVYLVSGGRREKIVAYFQGLPPPAIEASAGGGVPRDGIAF